MAEEELVDPNFNQTVVLMLDHDHQGALGLVVNRPAKTTLGEVVPTLQDHIAGAFPIYYGGPVQPEYLFVLHSGLPRLEGSDKAFSPFEGVVFEPDSLRVVEYIFSNPELFSQPLTAPEIRFYLGYSGWGGGQLENEMSLNSWISVGGESALVFGSGAEQVWKKALRKAGGVYKILADYGWKPSVN